MSSRLASPRDSVMSSPSQCKTSEQSASLSSLVKLWAPVEFSIVASKFIWSLKWEITEPLWPCTSRLAFSVGMLSTETGQTIKLKVGQCSFQTSPTEPARTSKSYTSAVDSSLHGSTVLSRKLTSVTSTGSCSSWRVSCFGRPSSRRRSPRTRESILSLPMMTLT